MPLAPEEALRIMQSGLGRAESEFITGLVRPVLWVVHDQTQPNEMRGRNGSTFFLYTGTRIFGVTANHVIQGWRNDMEEGRVVASEVEGTVSPELIENRIIDADKNIDILTFEPEQWMLEGRIFGGIAPPSWPPAPPDIDKGVIWAGCPGVETIWRDKHYLDLGIIAGGGVADSASERDVSCQFSREHAIPVKGFLPPEGFSYGGISGGPLLKVVDHDVGTSTPLRIWQLGGVIVEGPNGDDDASETESNSSISGFELFRARRTHFIQSNGTLDKTLWYNLP